MDPARLGDREVVLRLDPLRDDPGIERACELDDGLEDRLSVEVSWAPRTK